MYSDRAVQASEARLLSTPAFRSLYPQGIPSYSLDDTAGYTADLRSVVDEKGQLARRLSPEEQTFIAATLLRSTIDFRYWAERFVQIDSEGYGARPLFPLWESQAFVLNKLGDLEWQHEQEGHPDGLLLNVLKARQLGMCLDPATRVLTADLRWVSLDDLPPGQSLVATDEAPPYHGSGRKMRTAIVEAKRDVYKAAYRLTLNDGRVLVATGEHRLLTRNRGGVDTRWRRVDRMIVGECLRSLVRPWPDAPREFGWLGGLIDGEGCLREKDRAGVELSISQVAGPVYDRARRALENSGYQYREEVDRRVGGASSKLGNQPVYKLVVGRMHDIFRLLAHTRPVRFAQRRWWEGKELPGKKIGADWATVVSIEPLSPRRMIDLQTSTKTFLAEGIVSHNSTLAEALVAHRVLTHPRVRALVGADVDDQAGYLFRMIDRLYQSLPWFLKLQRVNFVKNREMVFNNQSYVKTAWGQSTRGALQSVTGQEGSKGAIARGQTFSTVHISELATWSNPEQLDSSLLPAIPIASSTLVIFESTAETAGDWWHKHWLAAEEDTGRFSNVFIPWYAEPTKYSLPAPLDWTPSSQTLQHAAKCEREGPKWVGHTVALTRDQLYWYERTRTYYQKKGELYKFLREYCADDQECFQYAGHAIFTLEQLEAIDVAGSRRPLLDVWAVEPAREIAELRRLPDQPPLTPAAARRPTPPLSPRIPLSTLATAAETFPVPPGYGFRRLTPDELKALPSLKSSVLAIWEYPRSRGRRRYVMGVDVSEGLELDYSVITVVRQPTIEEPAEDVAQYISNTVDTKQLAFICDAIGRFYCDEDGIEALAAIETGGPGLATQDTLQLHLGYANFYVWEYADAANPDRRFSTKLGWVTSSRTRPILVTSFHDAITTLDPIGGLPDFILNSPATRAELRHFVTASGRTSDAEHARGQHDDCIFSSSISYYVAWRLAGGETEPIAERRRRRTAQRQQTCDTAHQPRDWRNSDATAEEADHAQEDDDEFSDDRAGGGLHFTAVSAVRDRID